MIRSDAPIEYRSGGSRIESHSEVRSVVRSDTPVEYRSGGGQGEVRSGAMMIRSDGPGEYRSTHTEMRETRSIRPAEPNSPMQIRLAENREIGALNDRHADYISEVRFLQAVHRKLKMRLDQWMKAGKPGYTKDTITESLINGHNGWGDLKQRYDADAEKIPSLNIELNNTRSRYESALRGRDPSAEDSLLVRLCDVRSQICLAKGRGKVIEEECQRLRKENQKLMDDIASQRQIFDKETQERHTYERRAVPLLRECEELLRKCKLETATVPGYSFDDIEKDRKHFRSGVEASMGDIRRQYEILANTVSSEMEQWYKQQINGIDIKQREDASSYKKKLADLRAELVDVRTKLAHLEERNRLLTSLIGDFEDARDQEQRISDTCLQDDENHLKKLIDRYNELTSGSRDSKYTVATLRAEILRYRELLDGVGPRSNRDVSAILKSVFDRMDSRIVIRPSGSHEGGTTIGTGAVPLPPIGGGATSQTHITTSYVGGTTYAPYGSGTSQIGGGATSQTPIGGGATYAPYGSGTSQVGGGATSQTQIGGGATYAPYSSGTSQIGGGTTSQTQIGGGTTYAPYSSGTSQIGGGATSQTQIGGGTTYAPYGSGSQSGGGVTSQTYIGGGATSYPAVGGGATSQSQGVTTSHTYIGGGATSQPQIGGGATSHAGSVTGGHSQIGSGAIVAQPVGQGVSAQDVSSEGSVWSSRRYSWADRKPATVISTADYTIRDERAPIARSSAGDHREYSMQRSAQGNVTIGKVASDGSFVIIENTSMDADQHIGEWTLRSTSSSLRQVSYTFPRGFILTPQSTVQVFARGRGVHNPPRSVVCESDTTFATGDDLDIYLYDNNGQERARLTQRSFFRNGATHTTF